MFSLERMFFFSLSIATDKLFRICVVRQQNFDKKLCFQKKHMTGRSLARPEVFAMDQHTDTSVRSRQMICLLKQLNE